jgi:PAS domain S-box-containing protein
MSLRWTTGIIIAVTVLVLTGATYGLAQFLITDGFDELETAAARRNIDRAVNALDREVAELDTLIIDWAYWDDTYDFLQTRNPAYLQSNLPGETLPALAVNAFVLLDLDGQAVVTRGADSDGAPTAVPPQLIAAVGLEQLPPAGELDNWRSSGVALVDGEPWLFAARPVLRTNETGPARGLLIMGRRVDDTLVASLSDQTRLQVSIGTSVAEDLPPGSDDGPSFEPVAGNLLVAYTEVPTANGGPIIVRVDLPRDIAAEGRRVTRNVTLTILGAGLLLGVVTFVLLDTIVVRRMRVLGAGVRQVAAGGDLSGRVPAFGHDEVGQLAQDINHTLAALEESEGRYRRLVATAADGIFVIRDARATFANDAGLRIFGVEQRVLQARDFATFFAPADRERVYRLVETLGQQEAARLDGTVIRPDGEQRAVEMVATRVNAEADHGIQIVMRDVTEREREARARAEFDRKLQETQRLEGLGLLAGGIAHDFNNLLMAMLGNASLARLHAAGNPQVTEALKEIELATQRASELTRQLLAYAGGGKLVVNLVDLSELVRETGELMRAAITKNATLVVDTPDGLPAVEADATQLRQVVLNLITNASDALGNGSGRITVRTGATQRDAESLRGLLGGDRLQPGEYVFVEVTDTGSGMAPEVRDRIFDPFYSTKGPGRGLGLAAVLGILRSHGGGIEVLSAPGTGTTFRVFFPSTGKVLPKAPPAPATVGERMRGTILLVDDDVTVRRVARAVLEEIGFTVLIAGNGQECLEVMQERGHTVDAVVLDLLMPVMDGQEAARRLRAAWPDVPILIASGHSGDALPPDIARDPLVRFAQKPFGVAALATALRDLLGRRASRTA